VEDIRYIERGYENIIEKLHGLGAEIRRIEVPDGPVSQAVG
jgi:UDP-N-acetylglucosamine 1-carboxyvinyltransferase